MTVPSNFVTCKGEAFILSMICEIIPCGVYISMFFCKLQFDTCTSGNAILKMGAWVELPGPVEEVLRSVEKALKRHTQLMETLIRTGVKINSTHSSPPAAGDSDGKGGAQRQCSPESSSSAAQDDMAATSSATCKLWTSVMNQPVRSRTLDLFWGKRE